MDDQNQQKSAFVWIDSPGNSRCSNIIPPHLEAFQGHTRVTPTRHIWSPTLGSSKVVTHESQSFPELKALKARHESDTDKLNATGWSWSMYNIEGSVMPVHLPRQHGIQLHSYQWVFHKVFDADKAQNIQTQCLMCDAIVMDSWIIQTPRDNRYARFQMIKCLAKAQYDLHDAKRYLPTYLGRLFNMLIQHKLVNKPL